MFNEKLKRIIAVLLLVSMIVTNNSFVVFAENINNETASEKEESKVYRYYEEYIAEQSANSLSEEEDIEDDIEIEEPLDVEKEIPNENEEEVEEKEENDEEIIEEKEEETDSIYEEEVEDEIIEEDTTNRDEETETVKDDEEVTEEVTVEETEKEDITNESREEKENEKDKIEDDGEKIITEEVLISTESEIEISTEAEAEIENEEDLFLEIDKYVLEKATYSQTVFEKHVHKQCGFAIDEMCNHPRAFANHTEPIIYEEWNDDTEIKEGAYYLTKDIEYGIDINFSGNLYLCLNGHKLFLDDCVFVGLGETLNNNIYIADCTKNYSEICTTSDKSMFENTSIYVNNNKEEGEMIFIAEQFDNKGITVNRKAYFKHIDLFPEYAKRKRRKYGTDEEIDDITDSTERYFYRSPMFRIFASSMGVFIPPAGKKMGLFCFYDDPVQYPNEWSMFAPQDAGEKMDITGLSAEGPIFTVDGGRVQFIEADIRNNFGNGSLIRVINDGKIEFAQPEYETDTGVYNIENNSTIGSLITIEKGVMQIGAEAQVNIRDNIIRESDTTLAVVKIIETKRQQYEDDFDSSHWLGNLTITNNKLVRVTDKEEYPSALYIGEKTQIVTGNSFIAVRDNKIVGRTNKPFSKRSYEQVVASLSETDVNYPSIFQVMSYNSDGFLSQQEDTYFDANSTHMEIVFMKGNHTGTVFNGWNSSTVLAYTESVAKIAFLPDKTYNERFTTYVEGVGEDAKVKIGIEPENLVYYIDYNKGVPERASDGNNYSAGIQGTKERKRVQGYNTLFTLESEYILEGYKQLGWASRSGAKEWDYRCEEEVMQLATEDEQVITLYAVWTEVKYRVNFVSAFSVTEYGERLEEENGREVSYYSTLFFSDYNITRAGYQINGWILQSVEGQEEGSETIATGSEYPINYQMRKFTRQHNLTFNFYPKVYFNSYTIIYNANIPKKTDGQPFPYEGTMESQKMYYTYPERLSSNEFTVKGFSFVGWSRNPKAVIKNETEEQIENIINYGNGEFVWNITSTDGATINLYAVWAENTYTIVFDKGDNSENIPSVTYENLFYTDTITAPQGVFEKPGFIMRGYRFRGGYYYITSGSEVIGEEQLETDDIEVLGLNFFTMQEGGSYTEILTSSIFTSDVVLYYSAIYDSGSMTVYYHSNAPSDVNGNRYVSNVADYVVDMNLIDYEYAEPNRFYFEGYNFLGWAESTMSTTVKFGEEDSLMNSVPDETGGLHLYALWQAITYNVTYIKGNPNATVRTTNLNQTSSYDQKYNTKSGIFTYTGHTLSYYVVDSITYGGNSVEDAYLPKNRYSQGAQFYNLTTISNATVTFRAVWTQVPYKIVFDANAPEGITPTGNTTEMSFEGSETKPLSPNGFVVRGYGFSGWSRNPDAKVPTYLDGESVYGLGTYENEIITLYAIWGTLRGTIEFIPGFNPRPNDVMASLVVDSDEVLVPEPYTSFTTNANGDAFIFYNIASMRDINGNEIELTDDEKLQRVYPGEVASYLLRGNGWTTVLQKIYDTQYYIVYGTKRKDGAGGAIVDSDGIEHEILIQDETEETQIARMNERVRIKAPTSYKVTNGGYELTGVFENSGNQYTDGQIVENMTTTPYVDVVLDPRYKASTYNIEFMNGGLDSAIRNSMPNINNREYGTAYTFQNRYTWTGHTVEYFVLEKVTLVDGSVLEKDQFTRRKISKNEGSTLFGYKNLTTWSNATVTLRAVWTNNNYKIRFNPNVPRGYVLAENISIYTQDVSGGDTVFLTPNRYKINALQFVGWTKDPEVGEVDYFDNEEVYAISDGIQEYVDLYALWRSKRGIIKFLPGYDSTDFMPDISVTEEPNIPAPNQNSNNSGSPFRYYIIATITNVEGNIYEGGLTREEKLKKVYPGDESVALLRADGDTVTLIKIYSDVYYISLYGGYINDSDGVTHIAEPQEYNQTAYINDRVILGSPSYLDDVLYEGEPTFTIGGYTFVNTYHNMNDTADTKVYKYGEVLDCLAEAAGEEVLLGADFTPIEYYIRYNKSNSRATGNMRDDVVKFDEEKTLKATTYSLSGNTLEYWVFDSVVLKGVETKNKKNRRERYGGVYPNAVKNLCTVSEAYAVLKAVWSNVTYYIDYDPNLPNGYVLSSSETIDRLTLTGGQEGVITDQRYEAKGLEFLGWSRNQNAKEADYVAGDVIYGLADNNNQVITMYAVWKVIEGRIEFDPGHNSDEYIPPINTGDGSLIPVPGETKNDTNDDFVYYIIKDIVDVSGHPYELTDEEKLLKIDPKDNIPASSLIINEGDTVTLLKIYKEPYKVILDGNEKTDIDGNLYKPTPLQYVQEIYVNDRQRLASVSFVMDGGYVFNGTFIDDGYIVYSINQIVEKLAENKGDEVTLLADYNPIRYTLRFIPGNEGVTNPTVMADMPYRNYDTVYRFEPSVYYDFGTHNIEYFIIDKINKLSGEEVDKSSYEKKKVYIDGNYYNLTNINDAIVTLRAVWSDINYYIVYDPNVPEGYTLSEDSIPMATQSFSGGETRQLLENTYRVPGLSFAGWNTDANAESILYGDRENVSALAQTEGEIIPLFAIWGKLSGYMHFNPGHNSSEVIPSMEISSISNTLVPRPTNYYNNTSDPFLYYIIESMTDKNGTPYELTDREKLLKIDPDEDISASSLLRNDGDHITLIKIYNEPYTVLIKGNEIANLDGGAPFKGSPSEIRQIIYVNDRERLNADGLDIHFEMTGFEFNNTYLGTDNVSYTTNQIVEKLCNDKNKTYTVKAQYNPIKYRIEFDKGNPNVTVSGGEMVDNGIKYFNTQYNLPQTKYRYVAGGAIDYYVVDKVTLADGSILPQKQVNRKKIYRTPGTYQNLTTHNDARVTLKAVWTGVNYKINFLPNVPEGRSLREEIVMPQQEVKGGEDAVLTLNTYEVQGYEFAGWNIEAATTSVLYEDGATVYGLATRDDDVINLYAIWDKIGGTIEFDPGHNPKDGDVTETIDTGEEDDTRIPTPEEPYDSNADEDPFLYYIIKDIKDKTGSSLQMTDEELLRKIYPGEEASTVLRNNGDTVTLLKIYDEPYTVIHLGSVKEDSEKNIYYGTPSSFEQTIYVNDRARIATVSFSLEKAFKFNNTYIGDDTKEYKTGQIVEKLCEEEGESFAIAAQYAPIKYKIVFDKGNPNAIGNMDPITDIPYDEKKRLPSNRYSYTGHVFEYFVLDKVTLENGEELKKGDFERRRFEESREEYKNLTMYDGATVTLKAVWRNVDYYIYFEPNVPEGSVLEESITMPPQKISGGAQVELSENKYSVKQYKFLGWNKNPATTSILYRDKEVVYGLATKDNDEIELYAVWGRKNGKIEFDPGYNPKDGDVTESIDTEEGGDTKIPTPLAPYNSNADEDPFLYYIIKEMKDAAGNEIEMTDEEKLMKIDPTEDVDARDLLKEDGSTVTLIKIYEAPYRVKISGNSVTDYDAKVRYGSPSEVIQEIYVNDRERLEVVDFVLDGYIYSGTYTGEDDNTYVANATKSQIVEKLKENRDEEFNMAANYDPIRYTIVYDKGNPKVTGTMKETENVPYNATGRTLRGVNSVNANYAYVGHVFEKWVLETITKPDGTVIRVPNDQRLVFNDRAPFYNLTNIDGAVVTLKAIWREINFYVAFYPNLPTGHRLDSSDQTMERQKFVGAEEKALTKNVFTSKGLSFDGWALSSSSKEVYFKDEDIVCGLGNKDDDIIPVYGVWHEKKGTIVFDPGHLPKAGDITPNIDTGANPNAIIPEPKDEFKTNANEDDFKYYIIEKIVASSGEAYELTDDEKLLKIDPSKGNVLANSFIKNDGDVVTLIKIYDEPYKVVMNGSSVTDGEGEVHYGSPSEVIQYIDVNDRQRLINPKFTMDGGYVFLKTFRDDAENAYNVDQIVEKLCETKSQEFNLYANYEPIFYNVEFLPGNSLVSNPNAMARVENIRYDEAREVNNLYIYEGHTIEYFVVEKVTLEDETVIPAIHESERKKVFDTYVGLTDYKNATVTLKAVWTDVNYYIDFYPNLPEGFTLSSPGYIMPRQTFVGGQTSPLTKNEYKAVGLDFLGWNRDSSVNEVLYSDEEVVYGLSTRNDEVISLFAIWSKKSGTIEIDPGHNSTEEIPDIDVKNDDDKIPEPDKKQNDDGRPFLYYIIEKIVDKDGVPYELTDDEKLLKIDPKEGETRGATLLRKDGDTVTLMKIYDEPYTVKIQGGRKSTPDGYIYGSPSEVTQTIYVNDRERLDSPEFVIEGYDFLGTYLGQNSTVYTGNQIVEKLAPNMNDVFIMTAQYDAIKYFIEFDPGNPNVVNPNAMSKEVLGEEKLTFYYNTPKDIPGNSYSYGAKRMLEFVVDKVRREDGSELSPHEFTRLRIAPRGEVLNLTDQRNATVTLKAVWEGVSYRVLFDPNVPEGETLVNPDLVIAPIEFVGNEAHALNETIVNGEYWKIDGYVIKGWNTEAATTSVLYEKDEKVYDLATRDNDEIVLHAIWEKLSGKIEFNPGHNSDEVIEGQSADEPVKNPTEMTNNTDDPFLYYIIENIRDAEGNQYDMTDDELLVKINPGDNIKKYIRNNDDVITLLKIYNEPYTVYLTGENFTVDEIRYTVTPEYYTQEIYVNDRERLESGNFNVDSGYKFNNTFKDDLGVVASVSQIVERLANNKGDIYYTFAQFSPITYRVEFNPGNNNVLNPNGMSPLTNREFNTQYTFAAEDQKYRKVNHTFAYFVLDKVTSASGSVTQYTHAKDRVIVNANGTYKNLAKNQDATATLKAVWNGPNTRYQIRFNPNVPAGYELDETSATMSPLIISGGDQVPLTKNTYKISGLTFMGWNENPATTSVAFYDEETVYGLSTRDNDTINLYAIWVKKGGTIEYNPGHLSSEVIPPTKTDGSDGGDGLVAVPTQLINDDGDEFLYYIIEKIVDKDGVPYELTDEEKLKKIHPEGGVAGGSLIRNDGDTVTLIKIYNEPYDVTIHGNPPAVPESIEGENITNPLSYTQQIYVNDRERLEIPTFSLAGYEFTGVKGEDNLVYTRNQIVEKLRDYKGDLFNMNANWNPIRYSVVFNKNSETAVGEMAPILNRVYNVPYTFTNQFTNSGYGINYFRVEKIALPNGTEIINPDIATIGMTSSNVYRYYNLSTYDKSTVSVIPIWARKNMEVIYDPGHNGAGEIGEMADPTIAADPSGQIYNTEGKDFKYWIIATIADVSGSIPIEKPLTDDQKLMKIYPGDVLTGITDVEDAAMTLLAIYDEPYRVVMNGNPPESPVGGENIASPAVVEMEIDVNDRKRLEVRIDVPGYQMRGLSTRSEGGVAYNGNEIVEKLCEEEGQEFLLYAQWNPNTYNVVFEAGNSSITGSVPAMNNLLFDTAYSIPSNSFINAGYEFNNWKVSKVVDNTGASVTAAEKTFKYEDGVFYNLTTENGGTVTLIPEWAGKEYTVTLDSQGRGKTSDGATTYTVTLRHGEPYTLSGSMFTPNSSNTYISSYNTQPNGKGTGYSFRNYPTGLTTADTLTLYAIWERDSGSSGDNSGTGGSNSVSSNVTGNANASPNVGLLTDTTVYKKGSWIYRDNVDKWQYAANVNNIFTNDNDMFSNGNMYNKMNYEFEADDSVVYLADGFYQIGWNDQEHIFEFDKNGYMKTGFTEDKGNIYYLLNTTLNKGALARGPVNIGGKIYNFDESGILQKEQESVRSEAGGTWIYEPNVNKWRYQRNAHGSQAAEFLTGDIYRIYGQTDENYFMFDGQGYMMTGNVTYKGETYYLEESGPKEGALVYNKEVNSNISYLFNEQGKLVAQVKNTPNQQTTGWVQNVTTDGWQYLENNAQGIAMPLSNTYRRLESNGAYYDYIFGSNGNMQTGFTEYNGKIYYLEEEGAKLGAVNTENKIINGNSYTFNSDGTLATVNGVIYNYGLPLPK